MSIETVTVHLGRGDGELERSSCGQLVLRGGLASY